MQFHFPQIVTGLAFVTALAACGGGSGGGEAPTPAPPPAPAPVTVSLYAGSLGSPGGQDGVGTAAQFNQPTDVAQDLAGNIYVADFGNTTVRRITTDGRVTTLAGATAQPGSADGAGASARFAGPTGIAVDSAGNVYVADGPNSTLRRIAADGVVSTIAGVAGQSGLVNGDAATARLVAPGSVTVDATGSIYFVDLLQGLDGKRDYLVRKRAPDGTISTFAGNPDAPALVYGRDAKETRFVGHLGLATDAMGNLYVSEGSTGANIPFGSIRKFDREGRAVPIGLDATGVVGISYVRDISVTPDGTMYVVMNGVDQPSPTFITRYRTLLRVSPDGKTVTAIAGGSDISTVDGSLASSRFTDPTSVAVGPSGRIAVGETSTSAIRLVDTEKGTVTTLAGGTAGGDLDGAVAASRFNLPASMTSAEDGTLFVVDRSNRSLRKISTGGVVTTIARGLFFPDAVAARSTTGPVFVLEAPTTIGRSVKAVSQSGAVSNFADFLAPSAPNALAVDNAGNVYASESGNVVVFSPAGVKRIFSAGISASGLCTDSAGNVYFSSGNAVGVIDPAGKAVIRSAQAIEGKFIPKGLAVDPAGNIYIGDETKIRKITPQGAVSTIADITTVQGAPAGFDMSLLTSVSGLTWSGGALYATVLNAVIRITL